MTENTDTTPRRKRRTFEEKIADDRAKVDAMKRDAIGRRLVDAVATLRVVEGLAEDLGDGAIAEACEKMGATCREFLVKLEPKTE